MKRLLNKLLATILTVSMLLSPVAALADVDEAISVNGVDAAVSTVEEELAPEAKSEPAPVVEEATPAGEGDAAPAGEGDAAPEGEGDAAPAGEGDAAPEGEGDAAPAGEGDAAPEGEGDAAPAGEGDAAPAGDGGEGASQENVEESVEDGIVIGAVDSFVGEAESSDLPEDTLYSEEESGLSAETASGEVLYDSEETARLTVYNKAPDWGSATVIVDGSELQPVGYNNQFGDIQSIYYDVTRRKEVTVTLSPKDDGKLNAASVILYVDSTQENVTLGDNNSLTFTMGDSSAELNFRFYPPENAIELEEATNGVGGTVSITVGGVETRTASPNAEVTVTATPAEGYHVLSGGISNWTYIDSNLEKNATFEEDGSNFYDHTKPAVFTFKKNGTADHVKVVFVPEPDYTVTLTGGEGTQSRTFNSKVAADKEYFTVNGGYWYFIIPTVTQYDPFGNTTVYQRLVYNDGLPNSFTYTAGQMFYLPSSTVTLTASQVPYSVSITLGDETKEYTTAANPDQFATDQDGDLYFTTPNGNPFGSILTGQVMQYTYNDSTYLGGREILLADLTYNARLFAEMITYTVTIHGSGTYAEYNPTTHPDQFVLDDGHLNFVLPDYPFGTVEEGKKVEYRTGDDQSLQPFEIGGHFPLNQVQTHLYVTVESTGGGQGGGQGGGSGTRPEGAYDIQDLVPPNETVSSNGYMIMAFVGGQRVTYATPNTVVEIRVTKGDQCNITGIQAYSCPSPEGNPAEVGTEVTLTPTGEWTYTTDEWTYTLNMPAGILRFSTIFVGNPDSGSGGQGSGSGDDQPDSEGRYRISILGGEGGGATAFVGEVQVNSAKEDDTVRLRYDGGTTHAVVSYNGGSIDLGDGTNGTYHEFSMPPHHVTISLTFGGSGGNSGPGGQGGGEPIPSEGGQYNINIAESEHGKAYAQKNGTYVLSANANDPIHIEVRANQNYSPDSLTVTDANGNVINGTGIGDPWGFTMPNGPVMVTVNYIESHAIAVTEENFPDENLRNSLRMMGVHPIGTDPTLYVESGNIKNVELNGVKDFTGLELLTALKTIHIDNYSGESLKLANGTVTYIWFTNCESLKSIDLSGCTNLKEVNFEGNMPVVESLDVSGCTKLTTLKSCGAALKTLDVSKNTELTYLDCNSNQLKSLDLSKNTNLEFLSCFGNNLTTLDLSGCPEISKYVTEANRVSETTEEGDTFVGYYSDRENDEFALMCDDGVQISLAPTFAITTVVDAAQGSVDVPEKAAKDETVTVTLLPVDGFAAKGVAVTAEDNSVVEVNGSDGVYTFTMPGKPVTVTATFVPVPTVTAPTANALTYNGQDQALVTGGKTNWGALEYSLNGTNWAATVPNGKNAGKYSVYYRVPAGVDHAAFTPDEPVAVTIAQKKAKVTFSKKKTYGEQDTPVTDYVEHDLVTGDSLGNITFVREKGENVKRYAYALNTVENANYDVTVEGTLTIMPKTATLSWSRYDDLTYNGAEQIPTATVTNLKAGDECNVIVVADENDNATDAGNHTAVAVSLSNANYKLPEEDACKQIYTIAKADHADVEDAQQISISANGIANGTADLSACIPEGAVWSVKEFDGKLITAASAPADSAKNRTLTYTAAEAPADVTGGWVTVEISTTNYATYTATVTFATSDVFTLTFLDSKSGEVVDTRRLHEGVEYGTLPDMSRDFYTFDGWYDSASAGTKVTDKTVMGAGDATVFARWTANEYKVALNKGDHGEIPDEYQNGEKTFTIETEAFALPKLADVNDTDNGKVYTFSGWTLTGEDTAYIDVTIDPAVVLATPTGDATTITYTAKWTEGTMVGAVSYSVPDDDQSGILGLKDMGNDGKVSTDYEHDSNAEQSTNLAEALKKIAADNSENVKDNVDIPEDAEIAKVTVDMNITVTEDGDKDGILVEIADETKPDDVDVKTDFIDIGITQTTSYTVNGGTENTAVKPLTDLDRRVVEIPVKYDMTGRYNLRLYRKHGDDIRPLEPIYTRPASSKDMADGTFFVSGYGRTAVIYIYSSLFSTFAMSSDNVESYEVVFNSNGGTSVDTQRVYKGKKVTKPVNPTKAATATTEYTFDKWCIDEALTTEYDFNKEVTEGFTLYARWIEKAKEKTNNPAPAAQASTASPAPAVASAPAAPAEPAITIPKTPAGVKAKAAKKGKVTVSWKKIKKNKKTKALLKQIKGIEVQYSTDPTFTTDVQTRNLGKKKTKVTLKGLQKKTVYYVRVRYTDGAGGVSAWSAVKKVKTKKK